MVERKSCELHGTRDDDLKCFVQDSGRIWQALTLPQWRRCREPVCSWKWSVQPRPWQFVFFWTVYTYKSGYLAATSSARSWWSPWNCRHLPSMERSHWWWSSTPPTWGPCTAQMSSSVKCHLSLTPVKTQWFSEKALRISMKNLILQWHAVNFC